MSNVGKKIKHTVTGEIAEITSVAPWQDCYIARSQQGVDFFVSSEELHAQVWTILGPDNAANMCSCGAKFDRDFEHVHSSYCALYRPLL